MHINEIKASTVQWGVDPVPWCDRCYMGNPAQSSRINGCTAQRRSCTHTRTDFSHFLALSHIYTHIYIPPSLRAKETKKEGVGIFAHIHTNEWEYVAVQWKPCISAMSFCHYGFKFPRKVNKPHKNAFNQVDLLEIRGSWRAEILHFLHQWKINGVYWHRYCYGECSGK